jgi:hypothetical protein
VTRVLSVCTEEKIGLEREGEVRMFIGNMRTIAGKGRKIDGM